jgi:uncharacterized membrane protein
MGCLGLILLLFITLPVFFILIFLNIVTTGIMVIVTQWLAKPVPGLGIAMPFWIPPILSAALALLLSRDNPAPVAYIAGVVGTLIGADLLNWPNFKKLGSQVLSIGGAGVFDGIFLTGIVAALIA